MPAFSSRALFLLLHGPEPGRHLGAIAALSVRHAPKRWSWFGTFARRASYFSSILMIAVGIYVGDQGWANLSAHAVEGAVVTTPALRPSKGVL
jgi:hypothetical protein